MATWRIRTSDGLAWFNDQEYFTYKLWGCLSKLFIIVIILALIGLAAYYGDKKEKSDAPNKKEKTEVKKNKVENKSENAVEFEDVQSQEVIEETEENLTDDGNLEEQVESAESTEEKVDNFEEVPEEKPQDDSQEEALQDDLYNY